MFLASCSIYILIVNPGLQQGKRKAREGLKGRGISKQVDGIRSPCAQGVTAVTPSALPPNPCLGMIRVVATETLVVVLVREVPS